MPSYRKKPVIIQATQWFKHGDHPYVKGHRPPDEARSCETCKRIIREHGWIDTLEGGHIVCPGDWVITGVKGEKYPCKPDIFQATYEPVE